MFKWPEPDPRIEEARVQASADPNQLTVWDLLSESGKVPSVKGDGVQGEPETGVSGSPTETNPKR